MYLNKFLNRSSVREDKTMKIAKGWKPYFGLGWDIRLFYQFYLTIDLGVMYTGKWEAPSISIDYSKTKDRISQAVQGKANDVIADAGATTVDYNSIKSKLQDLGLSGDEVDNYANKALGYTPQITDQMTQDEVSQVAITSTEGIYKNMDDEIAKVNRDLKKTWNDNKITNYAKVWPIVKIGFTYKF